MFWRKHIPNFLIIARPLYDLLWKKAQWEWTQVHNEALRLLVFEANAYQSLGPIHLVEPVQIKWNQTLNLFFAKGTSGAHLAHRVLFT